MISLACVSTLSRGLGLLDPDIAPNSRTTSIVHGVYGLIRYSLEFWQHHVLSYAECGGDMSSDSMLTKFLLDLWSTHEQIRRLKHHGETNVQTVAAITNSASLDARMPLIKDSAILALLYESMQLRLKSQEEKSRDGKGKYMPIYRDWTNSET